MIELFLIAVGTALIANGESIGYALIGGAIGSGMWTLVRFSR